MSKVRLMVTESKCRCGYLKAGDTFLVDDLCPPICHELWNTIYPSVYALIFLYKSFPFCFKAREKRTV